MLFWETSEIVMKVRWNNVHIWLIILNVIAVVFILQIVFDVIPLWKCDMSPEKIERINSFVVDLSLGIITSTFFYYLLVYIGERKRGKDIRKLILWNLNSIASFMQVLFAYYVVKYGVGCRDGKYIDVDSSEFQRVNSPSREEIQFWYRDEQSDVAMNVCGSTERGFLCQNTDLLVRYTNQIRESSLFALEDTKMMLLINSIIRSSFVNDILLLKHNTEVEMAFGNFGQAVEDFHALYKELSHYAQIKNLVVMEENPRLGIPFIYK